MPRTKEKKDRTEQLPTGRVSKNEKEAIVTAWRDSELSYTDFILLLVSFYKMRDVTSRGAKRRLAKKEKR